MTNLQTIRTQIKELKNSISNALKFSYDNHVFFLSSELLSELQDAVDNQQASILILDCDQNAVEISDILGFLTNGTAQYNQIEAEYNPQWEILKNLTRQNVSEST
jgi:hypothetical protein